MVEHHVEHLPGNRAHMRARERRFHNVQWMPQRRGEDLSLESVVRVDGFDVADQLHAVLADVVEPAHEWAAIDCASFGDHQRLVRREAQGHVHLDAFRAQLLASLDAFARRGQLHHHVLVPARVLAPLAQHAIQIGGKYFYAHRPLHDVADLSDIGLVVLLVLLRHQRRIGGHAVQDSEGRRLADLLDAGCVDKEFHGASFRFLRLGCGYCGFYSKAYSQAMWPDLGDLTAYNPRA